MAHETHDVDEIQVFKVFNLLSSFLSINLLYITPSSTIEKMIGDKTQPYLSPLFASKASLNFHIYSSHITISLGINLNHLIGSQTADLLLGLLEVNRASCSFFSRQIDREDMGTKRYCES